MRRALVLALMLACWWPAAARSESNTPLTLNPIMTRGAATAPVTIIEFSDYQ